MTLDTETEAPKPIRADARRNRERVLDAARACFARSGKEAQIDEVAAAAGVGVGTVYRHFATKEALVAALAAEHFASETRVEAYPGCPVELWTVQGGPHQPALTADWAEPVWAFFAAHPKGKTGLDQG